VAITSLACSLLKQHDVGTPDPGQFIFSKQAVSTTPLQRPPAPSMHICHRAARQCPYQLTAVPSHSAVWSRRLPTSAGHLSSNAAIPRHPRAVLCRAVFRSTLVHAQHHTSAPSLEAAHWIDGTSFRTRASTAFRARPIVVVWSLPLHVADLQPVAWQACGEGYEPGCTVLLVINSLQ